MSVFWRSLLLQAGFCDERRQGLGFAWAADGVLRRQLGADPAGLAAARLRALEPVNVNPFVAPMIVAAWAGLERRAAAGDASACACASAMKGPLGAALAGPADAFFWGALRPLAAAAAILAALSARRAGASSPWLIGAAAGLAVFNAPALTARVVGAARGRDLGEGAAAWAAGLPAAKWIRAARWAAFAATLAAAAAALPLCGAKAPGALAATALGAGLSRAARGPWRLVAAAAIAAAAAYAAGWLR